MREAVIVEAVRTPVGRRNGKLKDWHPADLLGHTLKALVDRSGIDPELIDDVVTGCVSQTGEQGLNISRNGALAAGLPESVPATTVDRQCGSSQQAAHFVAQGVIAGAYDVAIAAGVECMTRVPMGITATAPRPDGATGTGFGPMMSSRYPGLVPQGLSAEMIAEKWGLSREEIDEFSLNSHKNAARAIEEGRFEKEIVPVPVKIDGNEEEFTQDEGVRFDTTLEKLGSLKPSFRPDGVVTAGNSSQISDGSAAVLIMEKEKALSLGLTPRARFHTFALAGVDPVIMLTGPIPATEKALAKAGLTLDEIDLVEINEAFATVVLAWAREYNPDMEKVNVNGGAVALGHPLGCSGAKLMTTLLHELERTGGRYGLQTMCEGGGLANATIIERLG
ncbi:MAG: steroid 3-ketoacyl-CoA thiolase [Acidobacteria bacterium]|nr:MAG: steroid 3-ketoacyl-CoA thiolase [Acidobacteriota bacterium]